MERVAIQNLKERKAMLFSNMIGLGDLLYHTPTIRYLANIFERVDLWTYYLEPFFRNPAVGKMYKVLDKNIPEPGHFYFDKCFFVGKVPKPIRHENCHTVDYVSVTALGIELQDKDKHLEFRISPKTYGKMWELVHRECPHGYVVLHPAIGWKSRTLPEEFYVELTEWLKKKGYEVVLVGKECRPNYKDADDINDKEVKTVYKGEWIKDCVNLMDKLTVEETAAVLDMADFAVLGETGLNPLAACTRVPYVYIPQLMPPEFRICFRGGVFGRDVSVVKRQGIYPSQDHTQNLVLSELPAWVPAMDDVFEAFERLE